VDALLLEAVGHPDAAEPGADDRDPVVRYVGTTRYHLVLHGTMASVTVKQDPQMPLLELISPDTAVAGPLPEIDPQRARLLQGMAASITEKGYAATTIADVVRHARVSKRTFYEQFADKEECLLDLYSVASDIMLAVIAGASESERPLRAGVEASVSEYLSALAAQPALTRTLLVEIQAAGPRALEMRKQVHQRFADQLRALVEDGRRQEPGLKPLSPAMSTAIVGGINELMLTAVQEGHTEELAELSGTAAELILSVIEPSA
jgi:AcrR family transcriptional regulator